MFDAEEMNQCKLTVRATSKGHQDEAEVIVTIQDKNDNAPLFTHDKYAGHVTEGVGVGSAVIGADGKALVFQAVDLDSGANSRVSFEVIGCKAFSVDPKTRELITVKVSHVFNDVTAEEYVMHVCK